MAKVDEKAAAADRERAACLAAHADELIRIAEDLKREAGRLTESAKHLTAPKHE